MTSGAEKDEAQLVAAAEAVERGRLVVMPTDTVYGVGTRPDDPTSTRRLFEAKRRPAHMELPVLVPSTEAAADLADLSPVALRLIARWWPGPLTVVVPRRGASREWDLGGGEETVGLRQPAHPVALELLRRAGPLAVSSANRSGRPTPTTCEEVRAVFGSEVAVYLCDDSGLGGAASSVVDLASDGPRILREGAISNDELRDALRVADS